MKQIVDKPDQVGRRFCDDRVDRLLCVEEAPPRFVCNLVRQRCWPFATIESVVAIPKNLPCLEVFAGDRTNSQSCQKMWKRKWLGKANEPQLNRHAATGDFQRAGHTAIEAWSEPNAWRSPLLVDAQAPFPCRERPVQ